MSDAISPAANISGAGAVHRSDVVPGVAIAVMRKALDLMEVQGEAVVSMIHSAAIPTTGTSAQTAASTPPPRPVSDPQTAQQVDLFA